MDIENIKSKIDEIIKVYSEPYEYTPYMSLTNDLGLKSLEVLCIIIDLEKEFNIIIPDDGINGNDTINDIYDYIANKVL